MCRVPSRGAVGSSRIHGTTSQCRLYVVERHYVIGIRGIRIPRLGCNCLWTLSRYLSLVCDAVNCVRDERYYSSMNWL